MYLPDFYSATEQNLAGWLHEKIVNREKENQICDYKASLDFSGSIKRELLKDLSGFANEIGGVILVGVPEESGDKGVPSQTYGIAPIKEFEIKVQSIIRNGVTPALPAVITRTINVGDGKVVYAIVHQKSWSAPHMVCLEDVSRYYKRIGDQTVLMQEHEIATKYQERTATQISVDEYIEGLKTGNEILETRDDIITTYIVPLPIRDAVIDFFSEDGRKIADDNVFIHETGGNPWIPDKDDLIAFQNGLNLSESHWVTKLFPSGSFTFVYAYSQENKQVLTQWIVRAGFGERVQTFVKKLYRELPICGDVHIRIEYQRPTGVRVTTHVPFVTNLEPHPELVTEKNVEVSIVTSVQKLIDSPKEIEALLLDRFANQVGLWKNPKDG